MIKRARTLEEICGAGLCIGCGLCESIAGRDRVEMTLVEPGFLRPRVKKPVPEDAMQAILETCPGVRIDGQLETKPPMMDPVFGPAVSVWRGRATDHEVQFRGAAGGVLTALGMFLLDRGKVDFVLHVAASKESPLHTERKLSFTATEVFEGTASRYGPAAPLIDLTALLERNQRFAVIGKPCDISAVHNLAQRDRRVRELIPYTLTLSCAGIPKLQSSYEFLARHDMREEQLETLRYRGHGWPGYTYAKTRDGREAKEWYMETWFPYKEKWKAQFRCKICPDHTGEVADVSSVDDWPSGAPERDEIIGRSLVVARTETGDLLIREAMQAGYLTFEDAPEKMQGMHDTQPHQVNKKRGIAMRLLAMWLAGVPLPRFRRIRVLHAALTTHPMFHLRNFLGMRRRLRAAEHHEQIP